MSFFLFFPSSFFPASTRQRYTRELRVPTEFYSQVFLYFLMAKFHWRRAISQRQSKRSDEMEFTPLYLSLKLNLFISKSRNELLLPCPIGRFPPESKREMAPSLSSSLARPLFSWRLMRSMRDERSIRFESESEENDSRNLVSVFTVARARQFSRSRGKTWKSQGKTAANKLNLSRWEATLDLGPLSFLSLPYFISFSPAISIAITKSIYHDARQKYATFKPLSRLRAPFFISLEQFSFNPCAAR